VNLRGLGVGVADGRHYAGLVRMADELQCTGQFRSQSDSRDITACGFLQTQKPLPVRGPHQRSIVGTTRATQPLPVVSATGLGHI